MHLLVHAATLQESVTPPVGAGFHVVDLTSRPSDLASHSQAARTRWIKRRYSNIVEPSEHYTADQTATLTRTMYLIMALHDDSDVYCIVQMHTSRPPALLPTPVAARRA
jgi:hypothetical protein